MDNTFQDSEGYTDDFRAKVAEDRAKQGWSLPEVWNLGEATGTWLGTLLHKFREVDEPIHDRGDEFWAELTRHADALVNYGDFDYDGEKTKGLSGQAIQDFLTTREASAKDALRWVADNLGRLWS